MKVYRLNASTSSKDLAALKAALIKKGAVTAADIEKEKKPDFPFTVPDFPFTFE